MKSESWFLIIMHPWNKARTLKVEKRTLIILGLGGIFFAGSLMFFAHEYFSLLLQRDQLISKVQQLHSQVAVLEKSLQKNVLPTLTIGGLKISRRTKGEGFSVGFQLINQNPQNHPISGTLALVARSDLPEGPVYRIIPEMRLSKGLPQEPEKGKKFTVEKQKFIEALFDSSCGKDFKTLMIFVYSSDGKLILEKSAAIPET
jgi:hypothetical protein